jgi:hypothetical protein
MKKEPMKEVLCARTPAALTCPDLRRTLAFYQREWGFEVLHYIRGVIAILRRESVTVQLWQRRDDMAPETIGCRLLVDCMEQWHQRLQSAPGQADPELVEKDWGLEWGLSDCDGNRLLLVQSAPHAARRKAGL